MSDDFPAGGDPEPELAQDTPAERVAMSADLTIQFAAANQQQLREWLDAGVLAIDLSSVAECDSSGVQLMLAATRSAQTRGQTLKLCAASEAVREVLTRYALTDLLALDTAD